MQPVSERPAASREAGQPDTRLDLGRIFEAREHISRMFRDTPQFGCPSLGNRLGCELVIKLETANPIRCFKGRGTEVVMSRLQEALIGRPRSAPAPAISGRHSHIVGGNAVLA
ncbi:hypothetical protein AJ87_46330 [Rhizobium yanglingense]|nr:hypothetical protein AJ87_46330 [Rhizobium yanglingense]